MECPGKTDVIYTSYHNHTTWSDGSAGIQEMVRSGQKAGLHEIGVSDHYALAPGTPRFSWAIPSDSLESYVAQVDEIRSQAKDIIVRLSLEVDFYPETVEITRKRLAAHSYDYLIGSVHFVDDFVIDLDSAHWEKLSQNNRDDIWRRYWIRLAHMAKTGIFDIVGHFDLPKKFGFYPSVDLTRDALAALDAIAAADMAIEINTAGWDKPVSEAYPSLFYLREANRRSIPLVINSDAHAAGEVVRHFERARQLAVEAGYAHVVRFENRKRYACPLEQQPAG